MDEIHGFHAIVIIIRFVEPGAERYTDKAAEEGPSAIEHAIPCPHGSQNFLVSDERDWT
jgi:hypothetical protein